MAKKGGRKSKVWYPSSKQIKMADLLLNPEDRRTKKEKCEEVGIAFKTLWTWMNDDRFLKYLSDRIDRYTNGALPEVWRALVQQCNRGNVNAMRLYFEMKELHPSQKNNF